MIDDHNSSKFFFMMQYYKGIKTFWDSMAQLLNVPLYAACINTKEILENYVPQFIRDQPDLDVANLISNISQGLTKE